MPARKSERPPASPDAVKRQRAGTYATSDGRFTVEDSSSGWLVFDGEQMDELGLPLARGPFATLDAAKAAIGPARSGPAPTSDLAARARGATGDRAGTGAAKPVAVPATTPRTTVQRDAPEPTIQEPRPRPRPKLVRAERPQRRPVVIRELRTVDGDALRAMWAANGFGSLGDDDRSLARLARRNPGLVLVAAEGTRVVGSALGAWDGRRGWIYHVATAASHRRQGIATRLIAEIESGLRALGCPKVNVMVRPENDDAAAFWRSLGYGPGTASQRSKELDAG